MRRSFVCFCLLVACTASAPAPRVPAVLARARCTLQSGQVQCADQRLDLRELGLHLPLRGAVPRLLGGLFVLDAQGVLLRIDKRGQPTGHEPGGYLALQATGQLLCTLDATGQLACFVDRHDERGCTANDPLPSAQPLANQFGVRFLASPEPSELCAQSAAGQPRCLQVSRPCQRACLRFPSCHAALRCVDACLPGQAPLTAEPVTQDYLARLQQS